MSAFTALAADLDLSKLPPPATVTVDFARDIQPILAKNCYSCHGAQRQKGELRWDVKALAMHGSEHGAVILPGHSADSLMIQLVAQVTPGRVMPAKGDPLTTEQIGLLRAWIDQARSGRTVWIRSVTWIAGTTGLSNQSPTPPRQR